MTAPITFTRAGFLRGARDVVPLVVGVVPFGVVAGIAAQGAGLSLGETVMMSGVVYAGASQIVALAIWTHPPSLFAVTLAALVVNLRLVLMGPVLSPWLDRLRGWRLWGSLFFLTDQNWALSVRDMNRGGRDAAYLLGNGLPMWTTWTVMSLAGFLAGAALRPPPGHPVFFAALAVFVALLSGMWRGRADVLPWLVAACVSIVMSRLLPGTFWYIVAGAIAGSVTGGLRDRARA